MSPFADHVTNSNPSSVWSGGTGNDTEPPCCTCWVSNISPVCPSLNLTVYPVDGGFGVVADVGFGVGFGVRVGVGVGFGVGVGVGVGVGIGVGVGFGVDVGVVEGVGFGVGLTVKYIVAVGVDKAGVAVKTGSSVGVGAAAVFFGALVATTVFCIVCVASFGPSIPVAPNTITAVSAAAAIADTKSKVFFFVFFCVLTVVKSIRAPQYLQNGLPSVTFLPHLLHTMPLPHKISILYDLDISQLDRRLISSVNSHSLKHPRINIRLKRI